MADARAVVCLLALAVVLGGCVGPGDDAALQGVKGGSGGGGGTVRDVPPAIPSFAGDLASADNSGTSVEVFSWTVTDANGDEDLIGVDLVIDMSGPASGQFSRTITKADVQATTEPGSYDGGGWKVWGGAALDGELYAKHQYTFPLGAPAGKYQFASSLEQASTTVATGPTDDTTVSVFSEVTIDPDPVDAAGTSQVGDNWGEWAANPGDSNVDGTNYLKITNTGQDATAAIVIDFSEAVFTGGTDSNYTIDIDDNVAFAWFEDTTPRTSAPNEGTFTFAAASADGSVAVTFTGLGNIIYVQYRVEQIPAVAAAQSYGAGFTATEL